MNGGLSADRGLSGLVVNTGDCRSPVYPFTQQTLLKFLSHWLCRLAMWWLYIASCGLQLKDAKALLCTVFILFSLYNDKHTGPWNQFAIEWDPNENQTIRSTGFHDTSYSSPKAGNLKSLFRHSSSLEFKAACLRAPPLWDNLYFWRAAEGLGLGNTQSAASAPVFASQCSPEGQRLHPPTMSPVLMCSQASSPCKAQSWYLVLKSHWRSAVPK